MAVAEIALVVLPQRWVSTGAERNAVAL